VINRRLKKYTVRIIAAIDKVGAAVRRTENGRYSAMSSGSESDIFFGGAMQKQKDSQGFSLKGTKIDQWVKAGTG